MLIATLAALAGCSSAEPEEDVDEDLGAIATRTYAFTYVNPAIPYTATQERVLQSALHWLATVAEKGRSPLRRSLAAQTLARIEAGDVLLGAVGSARGIDRFHMCMDFKLTACSGAPPAPDDTTWMGDEALGRTLASKLDGYQWGNRIYFSIQRNTDPKALAKTLAHEVNHVLNRSECSYYSDVTAHEVDGNKAFLEEYRAYVTECYFVNDASAGVDKCTQYATKILDTIYGFPHRLTDIVPSGTSAENATITRLVVETADGAPATLGRLLPEGRYWPRSFGACPTR